MNIFLIMVGGALGALSRYGVSLFAVSLFGTRFPWGTLIVNLSGCFFIGLIYSLGDRTSLVSHSFRLFFVTGYLGALTTFSSYALETVNTARDVNATLAVVNFCINNFLGVALVLLGIRLGRLI